LQAIVKKRKKKENPYRPRLVTIFHCHYG